MLRLASYDVVFQEIPGEVTLALNLSGCPNRCLGCHSPHLQGDTGELLDEELLDGLLERYGSAVTCVCFLGGDADPEGVGRLSVRVRQTTGGRLKTGWYSGRDEWPSEHFDYVKLGAYTEALGALGSPTTNQRFYRREGGDWVDATRLFA